MGNAAICGVNLADGRPIAASSQELQMPVGKLLTPDIEDRFRSKTSAVQIVADLAAGAGLDTVALYGLTLGPNATIRVRLSTADVTGAAGDALDSGEIVNGSRYLDRDYGALAYLHPQPVSGRYVRIDIVDPDAAYVEAGRLFVGQRTAFTYNVSYGWQVQWVDRSVVAETRGGQMQIWRDNRYRTLEFALEWVTAAQRYGIVETLDRVNGRRTDVWVVTDTDSPNLARDSIFGLVSDLTPVVQPAAVFDTGGPLFSKQYKIKERL